MRKKYLNDKGIFVIEVILAISLWLLFLSFIYPLLVMQIEQLVLLKEKFIAIDVLYFATETNPTETQTILINNKAYEYLVQSDENLMKGCVYTNQGKTLLLCTYISEH